VSPSTHDDRHPRIPGGDPGISRPRLPSQYLNLLPRLSARSSKSHPFGREGKNAPSKPTTLAPIPLCLHASCPVLQWQNIHYLPYYVYFMKHAANQVRYALTQRQPLPYLIGNSSLICIISNTIRAILPTKYGKLVHFPPASRTSLAEHAITFSFYVAFILARPEITPACRRTYPSLPYPAGTPPPKPHFLRCLPDDDCRIGSSSHCPTSLAIINLSISF